MLRCLLFLVIYIQLESNKRHKLFHVSYSLCVNYCYCVGAVCSFVLSTFTWKQIILILYSWWKERIDLINLVNNVFQVNMLLVYYQHHITYPYETHNEWAGWWAIYSYYLLKLQWRWITWAKRVSIVFIIILSERKIMWEIVLTYFN